MDIFIKHKLEKNDEGYTIKLYMNPFREEFADDLNNLKNGKTDDIEENIHGYIKRNIKDIKINTVKLMAGTVILTTVTMADPNIRNAELSVPAISAVSSLPFIYIVKPGDSLQNISKEYGISEESIKELNNLYMDNLYVGQQLILSEA